MLSSGWVWENTCKIWIEHKICQLLNAEFMPQTQFFSNFHQFIKKKSTKAIHHSTKSARNSRNYGQIIAESEKMHVKDWWKSTIHIHCTSRAQTCNTEKLMILSEKKEQLKFVEYASLRIRKKWASNVYWMMFIQNSLEDDRFLGKSQHGMIADSAAFGCIFFQPWYVACSTSFRRSNFVLKKSDWGCMILISLNRFSEKKVCILIKYHKKKWKVSMRILPIQLAHFPTHKEKNISIRHKDQLWVHRQQKMLSFAELSSCVCDS